MRVGTDGSKNAGGEAWGVMVGERKSVGGAALLRTLTRSGHLICPAFACGL